VMWSRPIEAVIAACDETIVLMSCLLSSLRRTEAEV
jgi:hypothetical protein